MSLRGFKTWLRDENAGIDEDFSGKHSSGPPNGNVGLDDGSINHYDVADPEVLGQLNAYIGSINEKEYLDPRVPVRQLQSKLAIIGLHFNDTFAPSLQEVEEQGLMTVELDVTQFGGRYGKLDDESREISSDDGISHRLGAELKLQLEYSISASNKYTITAKLVADVEDDSDITT